MENEDRRDDDEAAGRAAACCDRDDEKLGRAGDDDDELASKPDIALKGTTCFQMAQGCRKWQVVWPFVSIRRSEITITEYSWCDEYAAAMVHVKRGYPSSSPSMMMMITVDAKHTAPIPFASLSVSLAAALRLPVARPPFDRQSREIESITVLKGQRGTCYHHRFFMFRLASSSTLHDSGSIPFSTW